MLTNVRSPDSVAPPSIARLVGQRIGPRGRFELIELLGTGGSGSVFKANDTTLKRQVAIKVEGAVPAPAGHNRLMAEGQALSRLEHPNVVRLLDIVELDLGPGLVMEFVSDALERRSVPQRDIRTLIATLAAALCHSHDRGILHLDVKPANLMLARDGTLKIIDFGVGAWFASRHFFRRSSAVTSPVGTPKYMAPEQRLAHEADPRSDVWGIGAVLFELVTRGTGFGKPPGCAIQWASRLPQLVQQLGAKTAWFAPVLHRTLALDPNQRFQSMAELASVLGRTTSPWCWKPSLNTGVVHTNQTPVQAGICRKNVQVKD